MCMCILFWKQRRYTVCFLAFLGTFITAMLRLNFVYALVVMTKKIPLKHDPNKFEQEFIWSVSEQRTLLLPYFCGYILTSLAGGYLALRISSKKVFLGSILMGSILTCLTPVCAKWNYYAILALRILMGMAQGVGFPALYAILFKWVPLKEINKLYINVINGTNIGSAICIYLVNAISSGIGWEWIFYINSCFGLLWCILWIFLISESPITDKRISKKELTLLQDNISMSINLSVKKIPWKFIITSLPVWAVVASHCGQHVGLYLLQLKFPQLLNDFYGLHTDVAAWQHWITSIITPISGCIANNFIENEYLSVTHVRKLFNCGAFIFQTFVAVVAACWMTPVGSITCMCLITAIGTVSWGSYCVNHLDICPQYACITFGIANTFSYIPGLFSSQIVDYVVSGFSDATGWRIVFIVTSWFYTIAFVIYATFGSGERQSWAADEISLSKPRKTVKDFALTKSFCC